MAVMSLWTTTFLWSLYHETDKILSIIVTILRDSITLYKKGTKWWCATEIVDVRLKLLMYHRYVTENVTEIIKLSYPILVYHLKHHCDIEKNSYVSLLMNAHTLWVNIVNIFHIHHDSDSLNRRFMDSCFYDPYMKENFMDITYLSKWAIEIKDDIKVTQVFLQVNGSTNYACQVA